MVVIKETPTHILALADKQKTWAKSDWFVKPVKKTSELEDQLRKLRKAEIEECQKKGNPILPLSEITDSETLETRPYSGQWLRNVLGE